MTENTPTPEGKEQSQPAGQVDAEAFLGELKKINVGSVEDLKGKLNAGKEAGHLANLLGEVRKENQELKEMLRSMQSQPVQRPNANPEEGQPINLRTELRESLREELIAMEKDKIERERQAYEFVEQAKAIIESDVYYPHVKEIFAKHMNSPEVAAKIRAKKLNPVAEYKETVINFLGENLKQSTNVLEQITGKSRVAVPHVEHGDHVPTNLVSGNPSDPNGKEIEKFTAQVNKGKLPSDEEYVEIFQKFFPRRPPQK